MPSTSRVAAPAPNSSAAAPVASSDPTEDSTDSEALPAPPASREPRFLERVAHLRGRLAYQDGAPAAHLPIAIDNGCETLAGFTDSRGRFVFDDVALPARLRSLEGIRLSSEAVDEISIEPSSAALSANTGPEPWLIPRAATREIAAPVIVEGFVLAYLSNDPGTHAAIQFMKAVDIWSLGPDHGAMTIQALPEEVALARQAGFSVDVLYGDPLRMAAVTQNVRSYEARIEILRAHIEAARLAWKLAELGASRKPRSRVRVDAACVDRASAPQEP